MFLILNYFHCSKKDSSLKFMIKVLPGFIKSIAPMAEKLPLLGGFVGVFSELVGLCGEYMAYSSNLEELLFQVKESFGALEKALPMFECGLGEYRTGSMQRFSDLIVESNTFLKSLSGRNAVVNGVFAKQLSDEMVALTDQLKGCRMDMDGIIASFAAVLSEKRRVSGLLGHPDIFTSDIERHIAHFHAGSREWMFSLVTEWLLSDKAKRVFWLKGGAGMGKSAFAATLVKRLQADKSFLAAFFCRYGDSERSTPYAILKSIAAQCAEFIKGARQYFAAAFEALKLNGCNDFIKLAEMILLKPLQEYSATLGSVVMKPMVILIDALDEVGATPSDRKDFLKLITHSFSLLPTWIRIVVTSRPEEDIVKTFSNVLEPFEIQENDVRHEADLRMYITFLLEKVIEDQSELGDAIELVFTRSEGKFIYVSLFGDEIESTTNSTISLSVLMQRLPSGLNNVFRHNFDRLRNRNHQFFDEILRPLLHLIVFAQEPIPTSVLYAILKVDIGLQTKTEEHLKAMFPVREYNGVLCFLAFHKSVVDWLMDKSLSGSYISDDNVSFFVDGNVAHAQFAESILEQVSAKWLDSGLESVAPMLGSYLFRHGLRHLVQGNKSADAIRIAFRLTYIHRGVASVGIQTLITEFKWLSQMPIAEQQSVKLLYQLLVLSANKLPEGVASMEPLTTQILGRLPKYLLDEHSLLLGLWTEAWNWVSPNCKTWLCPSTATLTPPGLANEVTIDVGSVSDFIAIVYWFFN